MKKAVLTICLAVMLIVIMVKVDNPAIVCPYCDGASHDCLYWCIDGETRAEYHLTAEEIKQFNEYEMNRR